MIYLKQTAKSGLVMAVAGGLLAAGGIYAWRRLSQLSPNRPSDAKDAAHLMLQGEQSVVAFSAHPDDLELFAGGALRRMYQLGNHITVVVCTDGEGSRPAKNLGEKRQHEQRRAGSILGYDDIKFLQLRDRSLEDQDDLKKQVREILDQENPQMLLTFDYVHSHPWARHPDHLAIGEAVVHAANEKDLDAIVYLYGSAKPDVLVDIAPVIRQKVWAVSSHRSQFPGFYRQGANALVRRLASVTAWGSGYRYAEAFRSLHNIHTFVPPRAKTPPQKTVRIHQSGQSAPPN